MEAVSYTHLALFSRFDLRRKLIVMCRGSRSLFFQNRILPVSYTHLDVYKRQWQGWSVKGGRVPTSVYWGGISTGTRSS